MPCFYRSKFLHSASTRAGRDPGKFQMGECCDSHLGVSIGLVQNLSPAALAKKGAKREKHCNAMHGICVLKLWQVDIPIGTAWWSWYILRCFLCFCKTKGRTQHETSGANAHMWKASISCGDSSDLGSMIKRRSSHFEGDVTIHSESSLGSNMAQQFARFHLGFVLKFFWLLCNLLCIICVLSKRRILGFFWEENAGSLRGTRQARMQDV